MALAEIEEAHKYGVAWVGTDVWSDAITAKQYPEVYRLAPANSLVYVKAADWSAEHFKNIAIIAENICNPKKPSNLEFWNCLRR